MHTLHVGQQLAIFLERIRLHVLHRHDVFHVVEVDPRKARRQQKSRLGVVEDLDELGKAALNARLEDLFAHFFLNTKNLVQQPSF